MFEEHSNQYKRTTQPNSFQIFGYRFVRNRETGIYEPEAQEHGEDCQCIETEDGKPLEVRTTTDWRPILVGALISVLTLYFVFRTVHYTKLQWIQTIRAADAAKEASEAATSSANTASNSLKDSQKSFVINQRPYLVAGPPAFVGQFGANVPIKANVTIFNIGKSPAMRYNWHVKMVKFLPAPKGSPGGIKKLIDFMNAAFSDLDKQNQAGQVEQRNLKIEWSDLAPNASSFSTTQEPILLSTDEFTNLSTSNVTLFLIGAIEYTDSFKSDYRTSFCWYYFGTDPKIWHICDSHNAIR